VIEAGLFHRWNATAIATPGHVPVFTPTTNNRLSRNFSARAPLPAQTVSDTGQKNRSESRGVCDESGTSFPQAAVRAGAQ
jgi:hypothetical protein